MTTVARCVLPLSRCRLLSMPTCAHTVENHFGNTPSKVLITAGTMDLRRARDGTTQQKALTTVCKTHFVKGTTARFRAPQASAISPFGSRKRSGGRMKMNYEIMKSGAPKSRTVADANCRLSKSSPVTSSRIFGLQHSTEQVHFRDTACPPQTSQ